MTPPTPSLTHHWTPRLILALVLLVAWLVVLRAPLAQANGISVTSAADTTGGPDCTLRDAITAANTDTATGGCAAGAGADTITFGGDYTITLASALPALSGPLTLDGTGQSVAVSGNDAVRVFDIQAGAVVTISQLSIISGTTTGNGGGINNAGTLTLLNSILSGNRTTGLGAFGGGIFNFAVGTLTVTDSTLSSNTAEDSGAGIFNDGGTLTLLNSTLNGNLAEIGGGIFNGNDGGTVTITNSTFSGNSAEDSGGAIYNNSATVMMINSTLSGNVVDSFGGGIYNLEGALTITNSTFSGNAATDGGGGIYNGGGLVTVTNSTLSGNAAEGGSGGIHNLSGLVTITNSTFSGNTADSFGGGIVNGEGALTVTNSTFSGNSATDFGGGIYNAAGTLTVTNSTLGDNSAFNGGGIFNGSTLHLRNTLIANSLAGGDCQNSGTIATNANNLIEDGSCSPALSGDPNLGPLQDSGGVPTSSGLPPFTHALLPGSPAIDAAGDCTPFLDPDQDQRGVARPQGNECDIGAFEVAQPNMAVLGNGQVIASGDTSPSASDHTDFGVVSVGQSLIRTFTISNSGAVDLALTGSLVVTISGASAFSLAAAPATSIGSGASSPFQIRFTPTAAGPVTATLAIASNDPDESPYTFTVQGTACLNAITVTGTGDSGPGTLRQALAEICSGGVIDFAGGLANQTITLTSAQLSIAKTVTITNPSAANLAVSGNEAVRVFDIQAGAVVTISQLSIISGTVSGGLDGGGINNAGTLTLINSILSGNRATGPGADGGGIYNAGGGTVTVTNSTFSSNPATFGGGIYNAGTVTVTNSTFSGNSTNFDGGGIYNTSSGAVTVTNSTFNSNSTGGGAGGGILNAGGLTVTNSTFNGNPANFGGGIFNLSSGTVTVTNSTLSGNSAANDGGGIYNAGVVTATHSTLSGNSASSNGGGIFNASGPLHLRNSLIADSPAGGDCLNNATILTNINNLIEDGSCNTGATGFVSGDPNLGPLQDNGGPTFTHALLPDSPAIDAAGDCTVFLDPDEDQRGVARPLDGDDDGGPACDIGAFEVGSSQTFIYLPLILTSEVSN